MAMMRQKMGHFSTRLRMSRS
jgi:hypothetical protein